MKLYLVRHGESEGNEAGTHQHPETNLSPTGLKQAQFIATRFTKIPIDAILASPFQRAKQTAETIGLAIKKPVETSPLFQEIKRPSEILGKLEADPAITAIRKTIRDNWHNPNYRHSNEETFFEFRARAIKALEYIKGTDRENVLLVTHGLFLRALVCVMEFGDNLEPDHLKRSAAFFVASNTGITLCEWKDDKWKLVTWNDHAHLG